MDISKHYHSFFNLKQTIHEDRVVSDFKTKQGLETPQPNVPSYPHIAKVLKTNVRLRIRRQEVLVFRKNFRKH